MRGVRLAWLAVAAGCVVTPAGRAVAQELETSARSDQQSVIVFTYDDFADARPNTALDMVYRIPGFTLDNGDQIRGFAGAAGNVLIDGRRPTSKSETVGDVLSRLLVAQVERIELIRGGAPGIDMQGQAVVANVITKRQDRFQQILTASEFWYLGSGKSLPNWSYQATRTLGEHSFDFQLSRGRSLDDSVGGSASRTISFADGRPPVEQEAGSEGDGSVHTARANYKGPLLGGVFSLNGLVSVDEFKNEEQFWNASGAEEYVSRSSNDRGELGLNYTRPLTKKLEVEALALAKIAYGNGRNTGDDGAQSQLFTVDAEAGESIARLVLRYRPSESLAIEGGGEAAFNYREQQVALFVDAAQVALPSADVRVEELRGEGFVQGTWRPTSKWSLEAGVRVETSTISQSGDTTLERSFVYPKPRVLLTWSPSAAGQVRLRVEREVGQLNFRDFASNVSLNSGVLSAGNADLEPDKSWVYAAAFEKRFWDNGAIVVELAHADISDVVDQKPFEVLVDDNRDGVPDDANGDGLADRGLAAGPGNIGDGSETELEINLTLPLKRLGVAGGEFKVEASWSDTAVTDPLTGEQRRISEERPDEISLSFRQDLPKWKLTYGVEWFDGWKESSYRLQEVQDVYLEKFWSSFIEYKPTSRLSVRGEVNNFDPYTLVIQRQVFDGPRNTGALVLVDRTERQSQALAMLRVRYQIG